MKTILHVVGLYEGSARFTDRNHLVLPMLGTIRMKGSRKLIDALLNRVAETRSLATHYDNRPLIGSPPLTCCGR